MSLNQKTKKKLWLQLCTVIVAVAMVFSLVACNGGNKGNNGENGENQGDQQEDVLTGEASLHFTTEELPRIDGSLATVPLYESIATAVLGVDRDQARQYVEFTNTHPSYVSLVDGQRDVIFITYPSEEEQAYASENGVELEIVPVVREGFVFFVNHKNPVEDLSLQQIKDIYSGKITNWSQVGGEDITLTPYQRRINSGSQSGMLELVMKDTPIMEPPQENVIAEMGEIIEAVATYKNEKDAIGYSYYYFVTDMYGEEGIKLLKVDGVYPDKSTIQDGTYPIQTAYYAVFRADEPKDSPVRQLVDWVLQEEGQQLAESAGYVRINP